MRQPSMEQKYYELLKQRRPLDKAELSHYQSLKRGYQGECQFDVQIGELLGGPTGTLPPNYLCDLTLQQGRVTQVDSLLVTDDVVYQFEIKNYSSDLHWDGKQWQFESGFVLNDDPLVQLSRSSNVVKSLITELGYSIPVEPVLVFVNPDAYVELSSEPALKVLRSFEIRRYLLQLKQRHNQVGDFDSRRLHQLCQDILRCQLSYDTGWRQNRHPGLTDASGTAKPVPVGIVCANCGNLQLQHTKKKVICQCGAQETIMDALRRTVKEAQILEPNFKVCYPDIHCFTAGGVSRATIFRLLKELRKE